MENKKKSKAYIVWIVLSGVFVISYLVGVFNSNSSNKNNLNPTSPFVHTLEVTQKPIVSINSTFNQISQADQNRMGDIISGVIQNTVLVTSSVQNEIKNIFIKYGATEKEISDFAMYGPAFTVRYQKLFFEDALQSILSGTPIKSAERLKVEKEGLSIGIMTDERVKENDKMIEMIASNEPIISFDGQEVILTTDSIKYNLANIDSIGLRLKTLLDY